jgi:hypothetical protein
MVIRLAFGCGSFIIRTFHEVVYATASPGKAMNIQQQF